MQAAGIALPAALAIVVAPPLLAWLLPDYQTGLPPLTWLVPGAVALTLALPCSQYLVAVGRQRRALAGVLIAAIIAALGNHLALSGGYGLIGVAKATAWRLLSVGRRHLDLERVGRARALPLRGDAGIGVGADVGVGSMGAALLAALSRQLDRDLDEGSDCLHNMVLDGRHRMAAWRLARGTRTGP